jgi:hypothetical protein
MAIKPAKFGPYYWGVLHLACLGGIDPAALQALVYLFPAILPCPACGMHFAEVLNENPLPETNDPDALFKWSVDVHNTVNRKLEKPVFTYEEAYELWMTMPDAPKPKSTLDVKTILIIILAIALIVSILYKN